MEQRLDKQNLRLQQLQQQSRHPDMHFLQHRQHFTSQPKLMILFTAFLFIPLFVQTLIGFRYKLRLVEGNDHFVGCGFQLVII